MTQETLLSYKAISMPQDVPIISDRHLIELENQVQRLMEAHITLNQPIQVNKVISSCEICSGPHNTQYYMENPEQAFVDYASSRSNEVGGKPLANNQGPRNFNEATNAWKDKPNFNWERTQNFQLQDDAINKIDTLWKIVSEKLDNMLTYGVTNNNVTHINAMSYDHLESETPRNKEVIKCPSKLLSLKYQSQLSLVEQDMKSSSPKLVYLVNTITIVKKEDEPREPETSKLSEIGHDGSNLAKDLSDESIEPKKVTNDEGLSNLGDKECKDGVEKDNEWIEYEEPLDLVNL
ncbi:hypothetical protein Tco_1234780 [Tanacetum coccineum]